MLNDSVIRYVSRKANTVFEQDVFHFKLLDCRRLAHFDDILNRLLPKVKLFSVQSFGKNSCSLSGIGQWIVFGQFFFFAREFL